MTFSDGTVAELLRGTFVSTSYFSLLGIRPAIGRDFTEVDGRPGSPAVVLVSHAFWQQRLGARADAIGRPIRLDGADYTVVGALPQQSGPLERNQEFFVAQQFSPPPRRGPFLYTVIARFRPGVDHAAAAEELRAINKRIFPIWKSSYQDDKATWSMMDLKTHVVGDVSNVAGLALAAVALVWLIACTNASNLLVARVTSRRRELAVRAALGASRSRVVRYLLAESSVLAVGSCGWRSLREPRHAASARSRSQLLSAHAGDRFRRASPLVAGWPDGHERRDVRPRPGTARDGRAGGRLAAFDRTVIDR